MLKNPDLACKDEEPEADCKYAKQIVDGFCGTADGRTLCKKTCEECGKR